jgi:hypothetical protein
MLRCAQRFMLAVLLLFVAPAALAFDGVSLPQPATAPKSVLNASALSGLWYDPTQPFTGFTFSFDRDRSVAITWYVYDNDGNQVWLVGSAQLVGNRAEIDVIVTRGGLFPPAFRPDQVTRTPWGRVTLDVVSCTQIDVSWVPALPGYRAGSLRTAPLIITGGLPCEVTTGDDAGNSCAEAATVAASGTVSGRIDPEDDFDFYRVVVPDSGALRARSTTDASLDPYGALLDASCEVIIENDDTIERQFDVAGIVPAGTYFVRVSSYASASTGGYNVAINFDSSADDDYADDCASAAPIPAAGSLAGRIDFGIDADVFRIQLTQDGTFTAESSETSSLDPVGELLDANCEVIDANDDYNNRDFFFSDLLPAGTYFVRVRSYGRLSTGPYRLTTGFSPGTAPTDDHGDICGAATNVAPGSTTTGTIGTFADDDFFRVVVPTRGTLTSGTSSTTTLDPELAVFDFECQRIAENDDYGPGRNSLLTLAVDPGEYFIRVRPYNAGSTGGYAVTPTFVPTTTSADDHGDSCAAATRIAPEFSALGRIAPASDRDFFVFDVDGPATFTVRSSDSNSLDPIGAVLDANCSVIAENDDSNGDDFSVSVPVDVGTYYLRVGSAGSASADDYQLDFGYSGGTAPAATGKRAGSAPIGRKLELDSSLGMAVTSAKALAPATGKRIVNPSSLSGLWYDPAQPFQGFSFSFGGDGAVAVAWYVYSGTRQAWVIGNSNLQGNRVTMPMFIATGDPGFPPDYNPGAVTLEPWGTLTLDVRDCDSIRVTWTSTRPGFNGGTLDVVPLIVSGGLACEVIPEADDFGNSCAAATAIDLNAARNGRIDPATDEDYFRFTVGSRGNFAVQSGGSTTLNPRGALLDAGCQTLAQSDDAAGSEFAISRTLDPGTYYLRVSASNAASIGNYGFATSFSAVGSGGSTVAVELENSLIYDLDFRVGGGAPIRVLAGGSARETVTVNGPLAVTYALVGADIQGRPIGDLRGGSFDPVANPSGTIRFSVGNRIGSRVFFAPVIANKQSAAILVGVNMGLPQENRCNCTVPSGARDVRIGYYELLPNSNVRAYGASSGYSGSYSVWGSDPSGQGRPQLPVPIINVVQSPSGRASLQAATLPF